LYGSETWSLIFREERRLRNFDNTILTRIFAPERDEVPRDWGKQHNEELEDLFFSTDKVGVIELEKKLLAEHVARMGDSRGLYRVLMGKKRERDHLEDPGVDGRIILRWIFRKWDVGAWTGLIWLRMGRGGGTCYYVTERRVA
jgi:hypothetical protein